MSEKEREFNTEIEIAASPDEVWDALTEPSELVRWFPLDAAADLREGGRMRWSWGDAWTREARIEGRIRRRS